MANICSNDFLITFEGDALGEAINNKLTQLFKEKLNGEVIYQDDGIIEGYFDSRWSFPDDIFDDFFEEFNDDTIYMRCLSIEWGCNYVALTLYEDGNWSTQTFDF